MITYNVTYLSISPLATLCIQERDKYINVAMPPSRQNIYSNIVLYYIVLHPIYINKTKQLPSLLSWEGTLRSRWRGGDRDINELFSTRVVCRILNELQKQIRQTGTQRLHTLDRAASVQQVGLSVHELYNVLVTWGVDGVVWVLCRGFLHSPLDIE